MDTVTLRHPDHGALTVPLEWTDLEGPDPLLASGRAAPLIHPDLLLELAVLLRQMNNNEHTEHTDKA